jgi:hypothetical protein
LLESIVKAQQKVKIENAHNPVFAKKVEEIQASIAQQIASKFIVELPNKT